MIESVIYGLIALCLLALAVYLVIWVVRDVLKIPIPATVIQIFWVIIALLVILWMARLLLPGLGLGRWAGVLHSIV